MRHCGPKRGIILFSDKNRHIILRNGSIVDYFVDKIPNIGPEKRLCLGRAHSGSIFAYFDVCILHSLSRQKHCEVFYFSSANVDGLTEA